MSVQTDLFPGEPIPPVVVDLPICGTCVNYNAGPNRGEGGCGAVSATVAFTFTACERWFGLHQLHSPLYGRRAR